MVDLSLKYLRLLKRIHGYSLSFLHWLNPGGPEVYLFHEIVEDISLVKNVYTISEKSFSKFLKQQLANGLKPLEADDIEKVLSGKIKNAGKWFAVTFDDVYESVFTTAYPILKALRIPFILFITVDLLEKPGYLIREQLITLAADPLCTIGSHASHHVVFRKLNHAEVEKELLDSKKYLEQLIKRTVEVFAFPYGTVVTVSVKNIRQLRKSVYKFAFSALPGSLDQQWFTSRFFLPRINVDEAFVNGRT